MATISESDRNTIDITLDDPRAFKVLFVRSDGKDSDRCVVMGQADPSRVSLSPGTYTLRMEPLSDGPTQAITQAIDIEEETANLNLTNLFPAVFDSVAYQPITSARVGEMKQALRQSRIRSQRSLAPEPESAIDAHFDEPVERAQEPILKLQSLDQASAASITLRSDPNEALSFDVGLSHNWVQDEAGWLAADDLEIATEVSSEGTLQLRIEDLGLNKRRVRLTLAIQGRPAIRTPLPLFAGGLSVSIAPLWINGDVDALVRIEAESPKKQALVAALSELGRDDARSVLNWTAGEQGEAAMDVLLHKKQDLWAATVAALLLARTYQLNEVTNWAYNLESFAPHISDASVAAAWARAADPSIDVELAEEKTLDHLKMSRKIGAPTFKITHSIALELLNAIRGSSPDPKRREQARHEMAIWVRRAQHRLFKGPYIMWEQAGRQLQKGRLPNERYLRVARGKLTASGFENRLNSASV